MRNISLFRTHTTRVPGSANISLVTFDLDQGDLYIASERENSDGDVVVEVWRSQRIEERGDHDDESEVRVLHSDFLSSSPHGFLIGLENIARHDILVTLIFYV